MTFSREELLATKLRALLQRNKGRDLFDLGHALEVFDRLKIDRVIECFGLYLARAEQSVPRHEAERRMFAKLTKPTFLTDIRPLLPAEQAMKLDDAATKRIFERVFDNFIVRLPGDPWARTEEMKKHFGVLL